MPQTITTTSFRLSRVVNAPSERVFAAWTKPEALKRWWGPPGFTTPSAEVDLRIGGAYKLAMKSPDGETHVVFGTFIEIEAPKKLAYTWAWEEDDGAPSHESVVTVEFKPKGATTEIVLTHERLANAESRDKHIDGWNGCFDHLEQVLAAKDA